MKYCLSQFTNNYGHGDNLKVRTKPYALLLSVAVVSKPKSFLEIQQEQETDFHKPQGGASLSAASATTATPGSKTSSKGKAVVSGWVGREEMSFHTHNSSPEGAMKLKFAPFCSSQGALSDRTIFGLYIYVKKNPFWLKTMDYSPWFRSNFFPHS